MSFQATEWARGLPLHSGSAKFTLMMIASYAGTDDSCYPSLSTLASDTLQSVATVRRRIRELEQLGALTRFSRWTSPDGQVVVTAATVEGKDRPADCRQTSDELRLNLRLTADRVREQIAALGWDKPKRKPDEDDGEAAETHDEFEGRVSDCNPPENDDGGANLQPSPSHSCDTPGVSPGSHPLNRNSKTHLNQNPQSPLASDGEAAGQASDEVDVSVQHAINRFSEAYPIPITNLPLVRQLLAAMAGDERERVIFAAWGYRAFVRDQDRRAMDAHRFIRDGKWPGFVDSGHRAMPKPPPPEIRVDVGSETWKALVVARVIAAGSMRPLLFAGLRRSEVLHREPGRALLTLAPMFDQIGPWRPVVANSRPWHAWRDRLAECGLSMPEPRRLRLIAPEQRDNSGRLVRLAEYERGELFPCEWPPPKGAASQAA